ncbi:unnamed protein product [Phytophthora fragariaefolia]|uniref:Unnamed protein product n=1 Tax=Phytophthora fragariaefolia TaxID=1490495 RepID=A0A9W6TQV6_9STRA|nr:unnamed protein product [Phytophthora fragariaefolia]
MPDANEEEEHDEALETTTSPTTVTDSSLRSSSSSPSIMCASHRLDPNLVISDGDPSLESDEEASSEAEDALDDVSSSDEGEDEQEDEALPDELAGMTAALDLEKRVRGKTKHPNVEDIIRQSTPASASIGYADTVSK